MEPNAPAELRPTGENTNPPGDQDEGPPGADILVIELDSIIGRDGWHLETLLSEGS
jgi:hypothetical protein